MALCFRNPSDARQRLSVLHPGRIITSSAASLDFIVARWGGMPLVKQPVLTGALPLKNRDTVTDVSMGEDERPITTDGGAAAAKPAEKASQLGAIALMCILRSFIQDIEWGTRFGYMLVDVGNRASHLEIAYLDDVDARAIPIHGYHLLPE